MSSDPLRLLLVEDDVSIRRLLKRALTEAGYSVDDATTGEQALQRAAQQPPQLVILDLGLPDMDGQEVLRQLREWLQAPIIVLSAREKEEQKVQALDNGADDYLSKPFGMAELLARIRVALRHAHRAAENETPHFERGNLLIDFAARSVRVKGTEVHLTPIEYKLLAVFVRQAGKVLTHEYLLEEIWGPERARESHYVRVFMSRLRQKLEDDPTQPRYLLTEQGIGYRLAAD